MRRFISLLGGIAFALMSGGVASAQPHSYDSIVVDAVARACVDDDASYAKAIQRLGEDGWLVVPSDSHPILQSLLAMSDDLARRPNVPPSWKLLHTALSKEIDGETHYFVAGEASSDVLPAVHFCQIMNFDATVPVDALVVQTRFGLGQPKHIEQDGFVMDGWGETSRTPEITAVFADPAVADNSIVPVTGTTISIAY